MGRRPRCPAARDCLAGPPSPEPSPLLAAGGLLAWALADLGGDSDTSTVVLTETLQAETVVRTVTTEGETVERTVTGGGERSSAAPDSTVPDATTSPPSPPPSGESGRSLNDRGFALLQQGDATGALPLLEEAVSKLRGASSITEAYASYNLAWARFSTGRCDGVAGLLDRSQSIQGAPARDRPPPQPGRAALRQQLKLRRVRSGVGLGIPRTRSSAARNAVNPAAVWSIGAAYLNGRRGGGGTRRVVEECPRARPNEPTVVYRLPALAPALGCGPKL